MKKVISFLLVLCFVLSLCGLSNAQSVYTERKNSLAAKAGYRIAVSSDFTDFWHVDTNDYNGFVGEIAYERKLSKFLGIEAAAGFSNFTQYYQNVLLASDNLDSRFTNFYLSPSLKAYLPLKDLCLYLGGGPDYYYTVGKLQYNSPGGLTYNDTKRFSSFGYHGLAGVEYVIYRNPGEDSFYDAPVSFLIEYKYSKVVVSDADEGLIDYLNQNLGGGYSKHDLEAGGHNIMAGFRWHF